MKSLAPAEVRSEPATAPGMPFVDAAGRWCLWPISGSGAEMVCCGGKRVPGKPYCGEHLKAAMTPAAQNRERPPRIKTP
jgi:hypothetical protein